jgi:hypothetical protein
MTFDLVGGRRLLLAGTGNGLFWLVAGLAALALVLVLYGYERRLVSRRMGLGLLLLRIAAAVALVFALFEPIATRTYRETVRGRVIVGADLSESMATADPGRSAEERAKLQKVLNLDPAVPVEVLTRREVERRLLAGDWIKRIAADHNVEAVGFARDLVAGTPADLAEVLRRPAPPGDAAGLVTDWEPALERALKEKGAAPVLGVVLLTDGQRNAADEPGPAADRLAARGIPVYPVLIGSTVPPRDAAIAAIKAPDGVYKGDTASVEVTVKADGFAPGTPIPVTLERPNASPLRQDVRAPADGSRPVVTFRVPLDEVGPQALAVAVAPPTADSRPGNDRRTVTVQVADDKAHVLLVDGEARWEFQYLRNALARDPRVTVEAVVFHQPPPPSSAEPSYKTALPPLPDPARKAPDPLGAFDAIVLGDVTPRDATPEVWGRLDAYVAGRGGTLIVSPGPRSWPELAGVEAVRTLLPVLDPRPVPFDAAAIDPARPSLPPGVAVVPSPSAADAWPMLQFAPDPERSRSIWLGLPKLPWVLAGRAKPGATVLASAGGPGNEAVDTTAAIAAQPYGLGKVLWVGTDGTWRWRHRVGDAYHHRFWGQAVRWAASGKLTAGNRLVRFGPERPRIAEGDGVRLQARFADDAPDITPELLVAARIFKASKPAEGPSAAPTATGEAVAVVPLRIMPGQPRTFEGTAPGLPQGSYVVRLDVPQLADALKAEGATTPEASLEVAPRDTPERIELAARRDPLDRLASATGGRVFADYEADALPPLLRRLTRVETRTEETTLWDKPWALALFLALLTVEWAMRKRAGLP